jgi:tRNA(adenine34) deaminase
MNANKIDRPMMVRCYELAEQARTAGEPAVGSLVARGETVLAEAAEEVRGDDPFGHAELLAIRQAVNSHGKQALHGATLYTTKEPCFLCAYAIRWASLGRVVYAEPVEGIGGFTSAYPIGLADNIDAWDAPPQVDRF